VSSLSTPSATTVRRNSRDRLITARDDREVARVRRHALHEAVVDLDLVHRQLAQIGQRRRTGAEVVDGEADAEVAQPVERRQGPLDVAQHARLRDLERHLAAGTRYCFNIW
jgi:hypothetical protein